MEQLVEFRRYQVSVEVPTPREDWLTRLTDPVRGGCARCDGPLPDPPIYLNTDGDDGGLVTADFLCSWSCVLELAASVVAVADESYGPSVSVEEIEDWRNLPTEDSP